ncbi:sugar nucleotide-binding protein [Shewanella aquimarina]|uniref:sugar nucleotide-binding protein n=1 Tax=Shewanella aquimarina TaxID=260365 RepID=UPI002014B2BA|nr:sugar nucleotide-binding protein [Shewanella aquimarina]MCL2911258.1 NAD(P)-dependent oxidoreductase [Shewanella aquimarina]
MRKILVIGRQGQVAQALKATQPNDYWVDYQGLIDQATKVSPTSTQDYGAPAPRPPYSALDCSQSQTILPAKPWQVNLSQVLQQLVKEG